MSIIFANKTTDSIVLLAIVFTLIYFYVKWWYQYWNRIGVKSIKPTFPFGNLGEAAGQKTSFGDLVTKLYNQTNEPLIGIFSGFKPTLLVRDPELVRAIFIKDFQNFIDRGFLVDEEIDPLSGNLFSLEGDKWRNLRGKLTPTFTSGKLKAMFSTLLDCGGPLIEYVNNVAANGDQIEIRELLAQYTTNVIASVAFGIEINCVGNPDQDFRKFGRKVCFKFFFFLSYHTYLPNV